MHSKHKSTFSLWWINCLSKAAWSPPRKEKLDSLNKRTQRTLWKSYFHYWNELFEGAGFIRGRHSIQLLYPGWFNDADNANEGMEHWWCQIRGKKKKKDAISANWLHRSHEVFNYLQTELIACSNTYPSPYKTPNKIKDQNHLLWIILRGNRCIISSAGREKKIIQEKPFKCQSPRVLFNLAVLVICLPLANLSNIKDKVLWGEKQNIYCKVPVETNRRQTAETQRTGREGANNWNSKPELHTEKARTPLKKTLLTV